MTVALFFLGVALNLAQAQDPLEIGPIGAPGIAHYWPPALKQAVGTAYEKTTANSPVWFTVAQGILTETFYPTPDLAQVSDLQLLFTDQSGLFIDSKRDIESKVSYEGAAVKIQGREKNNRFEIDQKIITDPKTSALHLFTQIHFNIAPLKIYVLFKPTLGNSAKNNFGIASPDALTATAQIPNSPVAALSSSTGFAQAAAGYVGFSDGWQDLSKNYKIKNPWKSAGPGNIALTGELNQDLNQKDFSFELILSFAASEKLLADIQAKTSRPFAEVLDDYELGWSSYFNQLLPYAQEGFSHRSAQIIKTHEAKNHRGAIVASLSNPAIPDGENASNENGGYHLIWPRDLYNAAMALLAAGDLQTPVDVLSDYVRNQKSDGSWPQNYWVDGTAYWQGLQLDEVSFPILLAWQLKKHQIHTPSDFELKMVQNAANFLIKNGPISPMDRWEEIGGYIPSSLAAEIAALEAATRLTGDPTYSNKAQTWKDSLESHTLVQTGPWGKNYYLRVSPAGQPNSHEIIQIANGGKKTFADEVLDGGFLQLVRLGIRSAQDPNILSTLTTYQNPRLGISKAGQYKRYNFDQYGPQHVGGYWPLLASEMGHYAVESGDLTLARAQYDELIQSALPSGLIPEQVIRTRPDLEYGLGVASPLVWAHAEELLLKRSLIEGKVFDSP